MHLVPSPMQGIGGLRGARSTPLLPAQQGILRSKPFLRRAFSIAIVGHSGDAPCCGAPAFQQLQRGASCSMPHTLGNQRVARMFIGRPRNKGDDRGIRSRCAVVVVGRTHSNHYSARIVLASLTRVSQRSRSRILGPAASRLSQGSPCAPHRGARFTRVGARVRMRTPASPALVAMILHRLGKTEAAARLRSGLAEARPALVRVLTLQPNR